MHVASSGGRCAPGVCAVDELEEFLEVGRSSDDDVLGGGDGPRRLVLGLHHTLDESQPVELSAHTKGHHKRRYTIQKKNAVSPFCITCLAKLTHFCLEWVIQTSRFSFDILFFFFKVCSVLN